MGSDEVSPTEPPTEPPRVPVNASSSSMRREKCIAVSGNGQNTTTIMI